MANSLHSSFSKVWIYPYPADDVMPTAYFISGGGVIPGLISRSVSGMGSTQSVS